MFSLTNILLFLNLFTLTTYNFIRWQGTARGSLTTHISYWFIFLEYFVAQTLKKC